MHKSIHFDEYIQKKKIKDGKKIACCFYRITGAHMKRANEKFSCKNQYAAQKNIKQKLAESLCKKGQMPTVPQWELITEANSTLFTFRVTHDI